MNKKRSRNGEDKKKKKTSIFYFLIHVAEENKIMKDMVHGALVKKTSF